LSSSTLVIVVPLFDRAVSTRSTLRANAHSSGCRVLGSSPVPCRPLTSLFPLTPGVGSPPADFCHLLLVLPHWPVCTSLPPYEQLLIAEGLMLWCLVVRIRRFPFSLVLTPSSSNQHPQSTPRAVAREAGTGGVVVGSSSAGSMFGVGGRRRASVTWREGGWLVLTWRVSPSTGLPVPFAVLCWAR
jgi:hypothetical protein